MKNIKAFESYEAGEELNEYDSWARLSAKCRKEYPNAGKPAELMFNFFVNPTGKRSGELQGMDWKTGTSTRSTGEESVVKAVEMIENEEQFREEFGLLWCMINAYYENNRNWLPKWMTGNFDSPKNVLEWLEKAAFTTFGVLPDPGESDLRRRFVIATGKYKFNSDGY
jgi:hypothetical protein